MGNENKHFHQGDRVITKNGKLGTVVYIRFAPPSFNQILALSITLDERKENPGYTGTMFSVDDVNHLE